MGRGASFLIAILLGSMFTVLSIPGGGIREAKATSDPIITMTGGPTGGPLPDGYVFHYNRGSGPAVDIVSVRAEDPDGGDITFQNTTLPEGVQFIGPNRSPVPPPTPDTPRLSPATFMLQINGPQMINGILKQNGFTPAPTGCDLSPPALLFPAFLGVTFTVRDKDNQTKTDSKSILMVLEDCPSPVSISLRDAAIESTAIITIRDFDMNKKAAIFGNSSDNDMISARVTSSFGNVVVPLNEVTNNPSGGTGVFSGQVTFTSASSPPAGSLRVNSSSDNILIEDLGAAGTTVRGNRTVMINSATMCFCSSPAKDVLLFNNTQTITVTDPTANLSPNKADQITIDAVSTSDLAGIKLNLIETGPNTGVFQGTLAFDKSASSSGILKANFGDNVTLGYKGQSTNATISDPPSIQFTKGRLPTDNYTDIEVAGLKVIDPESNLNITMVDSIFVTLTSSEDSKGINVELREDGIDSGRFFNKYYIALSNVTDNENSTTIDVVGKGPVSLQASYKGMSATATVSHVPPLERGPGGIGSNGLPPVTGKPIGSITALDCASYGGDGETTNDLTTGDGICDNWEVPAVTVLTIPYGGNSFSFSYFCDTTCPDSRNVKDIVTEIDWTDNTPPDSTILSAIKTTFSNNGYKLHIQKNENTKTTMANGNTNQMYTWSVPTGGNGDSFTDMKTTYLGSSTERNDAHPVNLKYAKRQVLHYGLYGEHLKQQHDPGSSGIGEIIGNDYIVSLGSFSVSADKVKGTILHELGHNLGLDHGGGVTNLTPVTWLTDYAVNCKPNRISAMSYQRQFDVMAGTLVQTPYYSSWGLTPSTIDETGSLSESGSSGGLGGVATSIFFGPGAIYYAAIGSSRTNVDWNRDGDTSDSGLSIDLVDLGSGYSGCDHNNALTANGSPINGQLKDFNDWTHLVLNFRKYNPSTFSNGVYNSHPVSDLTIDTWHLIVKSGLTSCINVTSAEVQNLTDDSFTRLENKSTILNDLDKASSLLQDYDLNGTADKLTDARITIEDSVKPTPGKPILDSLSVCLNYLQNEINPQTKVSSFDLSNHSRPEKIRISSSGVNKVDDFFQLDSGSITMNLNGHGLMQITIPTSLINNSQVSQDNPFPNNQTTVMTDTNEFPSFTAVSMNNTSITIELSYPDGAKQLKIMDNRIVPEFPVLTMVITALSLGAVIVLLRLGVHKRKFFDSGRY